MSYKPGDPYSTEFCTQTPGTAAATTADSLPVATANHNGADDSAFTLTVTLIDPGRYKITGTVPSGYASGDSVSISVAATMATVVGKAVVDKFVVDANRVVDVYSKIRRNDGHDNFSRRTQNGTLTLIKGRDYKATADSRAR